MSLAVIIAALHPSSNLLGRFQAQLFVEVGEIYKEDQGAANHANRLALANKILESDSFTTAAASRLLRLALALNSDAQTKGNELDDDDIAYIVRTTQLNDAAIVAELNAL